MTLTSLAQVQTNVSAFFKSGLLYNPAMAGLQESLTFLFLQKNQSLNYSGMPTLTVLSGSLPFNYERLGIGLNLIKETANPSNTISLNANFSYKINFYKGRMSLGIRSGFLHRSENLASVTAKDQEYISNGLNQKYLTVGGGFFYKDKNKFAGFSFDRSASIYFRESDNLINQYHLLLGHTYHLSSEVSFDPTAQIRYMPGFPVLAELYISVTYRQLLLAGISMSSSLKSSFSFGLDVGRLGESLNKSIFIIYSYDHVWGSLNSYLGNTHEIAIVVNWGNAERTERILKRKITVSPLYFD
jgi:type IX secretion system PorP/SprF family membrane protein